MAAEREAKLKLDFDTVQAQRSAEEQLRAAERLKATVNDLEESYRRAGHAASEVDWSGPVPTVTATPVKTKGLTFEERFANEQATLELQARERERVEGERAERAAARAAERAEEQASREAQARYVSSMNAVTGFASSGSVGSLLPLLGHSAIPAALAMAAGNRAMDIGTTAGLVGNHAGLTSAQRVNLIADEFFPVVRSLREFTRAVDGTAERLRQAQLALELGSQINQVAGRQRTERHMMEADVFGARIRAGVMGGAFAPPVQQFDRTTLSGEIAHQEEQMRVGPRDALASAQREAEISRQIARDAAERADRADAELAQSIEARDRHQAQVESIMENEDRPTLERGNRILDILGEMAMEVPAYRPLVERGRLAAQNAPEGLRDFVSGAAAPSVGALGALGNAMVRDQAGRAEAGGSVANDLDRENALRAESIRLRQEAGNAGVRAAEAETRVRQSGIEVLKTELEILQQRERRLMGDQSRLGGMSWLGRQTGLNAARMVRDRGVDGVPLAVLEESRQFAREWTELQIRQFGERTPEFEAGRREGFLTPGQETLAQNREQQRELAQQIRDQEVENQQRLAKESARLLGDTFRAVMQEFINELQAVKLKFTNTQRLNNNAPG